MQPIDCSATRVVPHQWDRRAGEIEGVAEWSVTTFTHRGIVNILRRIDRALQCAHSCAALEKRLDQIRQQIRLQRDLVALKVYEHIAAGRCCATAATRSVPVRKAPARP